MKSSTYYTKGLILLLIAVTFLGACDLFNSSSPLVEDTRPQIQLLGPANGDTGTTYPRFAWLNLKSFTSYHFQLSESEDFDSLIVDRLSIPTLYTNVNSEELQTGTYYWRVRGNRADGSNSPWIGSRSYILQPLTLSSTTPANGSSLTSAPSLLQWNDIEEATSYEIQVSYSNSFVSLIETATVLSPEYSCTENYFEGSSYFWRVRIFNEKGFPSNWSNPLSFSIGYSSPDAVVTTLSSLSANQGTLFPEFNPGVYNYELTLPLNIDNCIFTTDQSDDDATMSATLIRDSLIIVDDTTPGEDLTGSSPYNLTEIGDGNVFRVIVSDNDATSPIFTTYKVTLNLSHSTELATLSASSHDNSVTLVPAFDSQITEYTVPLAAGATEVTLTTSAQETALTPVITYNDSAVTSWPQTISDGGQFAITLNSGEESKTYNLTVDVPVIDTPPATTLSSLGVSPGSISPVFSSSTAAYTWTLPLNSTSGTVHALKTDNGATLQVLLGESEVSSWPVNLGDDSSFTLRVSGDGSDQQDYTLAVNLTHSDLLNQLTTTAGTLTPAFSPTTTSYTLEVPSAIDNLQLLGETLENAATYEVSYNGSDVETWPVTVADGGVFQITLTDGGGTEKTYTVTVNKETEQILPSGDDLVITEISGNYYSNREEWIELYNNSSSSINLSGYNLRIADPDSSSILTFTFPSRSVAPGEYVVARSHNGGAADKQGFHNIFLSNSNNETFIWGSNGFVDLVKNNQTIDFIRFGDDENTPLTAGQWGSTNAPAFSGQVNRYGISLTRDIDNTDTNESADWTYTEWASPGGPHDILGTVDNDADGIPDANEAPGETYLGLPLYEWGARPNQVDHFVHIAYMVNPTGESPGIFPQPDSLAKVTEAFEAEDASGTEHRVHYDVGNTTAYTAFFRDDMSIYNLDNQDHSLPYYETITITQEPAAAIDFYELKADYLPVNKRMIFHFLIMGSSQLSGGSGIAEVNGNDVLITVREDRDPVNGDYGTYHCNVQSLALMHELGHNLGLLHGGGESENYKPNYVSIMNYMNSAGKGLPIIGLNEFEGDRYYYYQHAKIYGYDQANPFAGKFGNSFYTSDFEQSPYTTDFVIDFSDGSSLDLNENSIDEKDGLGRPGSAWVDFDGDGQIDTALNMDLNSYDTTGGDNILTDYNDWANINSVFRRRDTRLFRSIQPVEEFVTIDPLVDDAQELTVDFFEELYAEGELW